MIQLLFLMLGARALQPTWRLLVLAGATWMGVGLLILWDLTDGETSVVLDTFAIILVVEGLVEIGAVFMSQPKGSLLDAARGLAYICAAASVVALPGDDDLGAALVFGVAFLMDGLLRLTSAYVIHSRRWRKGAIAGAVELGLAATILASWPIPYHLAVPFCLALLSVTSGYAVLSMSWQLRLLSPGGSVTALPLYMKGNWHALTLRAVLPTAVDSENICLRVHVWTALGSLDDVRRRPLIDRYIAAVDREGVVSTGHSSLELSPDLYISHYPANDIDHHPHDFRALLSARPENNVPGRFLPSLQQEVAEWRIPDHTISFGRANAAALRAFWRVYSADATYNLTGRNCSSTVVLALDVALEGWASTGRPCRDFLGLLVDPYFWMLRILRGRAEAMTWTPGLVLDYVRVLHLLRSGKRAWWWTRLAHFIAVNRRSRAGPSQDEGQRTIA